ncbi:TonB-dependent receptor, partial [uncultured Desulfuromusa sp.]|uniref:TonB-dependent receptor n=1 Tax=uncultured Desulfuromusa sp. TaxID=219183 RepID=UPI002AA68D20
AINQVEGKDNYAKDMQPESSTTYEYGIRYGAEGLVKEDDRLHLKLAFFDTEIENLILQVGGRRGLPVSGFYNEDPVTSKGYEAKLGWSSGGFDTNLSYTHAVTEDENGNAIAFSRRIAASAGDTLVWG